MVILLVGIVWNGGGTFFRSTTERMEKQILSFDRLRTGALLRMTKRESGRCTEGKDPGSSITNVEDDRRGGGEDDRFFSSAHPFVWVRLAQNPGFLYLTGSPIKNVGDKRRE